MIDTLSSFQVSAPDLIFSQPQLSSAVYGISRFILDFQIQRKLHFGFLPFRSKISQSRYRILFFCFFTYWLAFWFLGSVDVLTKQPLLIFQMGQFRFGLETDFELENWNSK